MGAHEERIRLSAEYKIASAHYAWAVAELKRRQITSTDEDWAKLNRVVDEARNECERIRAELASTHY
jgi:hypothetical protein